VRIRGRRAVGAISILMLLAWLAAATVLAQEATLEGKLLSGDEVTVPAGQTVPHDLYAFAGRITVDGTVEGDLVVAAGEISINGTVQGDVIAAGGTVVVGGTVEGDLRAAGGQLTVGGEVTEDAFVASGQFSLGSGGLIGEDLGFSAGQARLDGVVAGSVRGSAGEYARSGTIGGSEEVEVDQGSAGPTSPRAVDLVADAIRHFLVVLGVGALALWVAPALTRASEAEVRRRPLFAFGAGLLVLVGCVVLIVAVFVLVVLSAIILGALGFGALVAIDVIAGILGISALVLLLIVVAAFLVDALVGLAIGRLVGRGFASDRWRELAILALGAAVVVLATYLPVAGGFVKFVVVCLGLGALLLTLNGLRRPRLPAPAATVETPA
jgi:cytoskeletal protein CcmA (bactofilin family)